MAETGVYVYAVTRDLQDSDVQACPGVGTSPVRVVEHRGLSAAVSDVDLGEFGEEGLRRNLEDLTWLERVARAHDEVVQTIGAQRATAPLRLATVYFDDDGVRARLEELHDPLSTSLERVEGRSEWSVKVSSPPSAAPEAPTERGKETGTAYLRRRRAETTRRERTAQEAAETAVAVHRSLSEFVVASRRLAPQDQRLTGDEATMVLNGAYLVDQSRSALFQDLVEHVRGEHPDVRVDLAGPWPPYSFVAVE